MELPADIDVDGLDRDSASELSPRDAEEERKRKIHELALKRFKIAQDELREQREREKVDQRFVQNIELSDQWPEAVLRARGAIENEDGDVPYRPCITINELAIPCQQVVNEARQSRFAVKIAPQGKRARKQDAWLRQGLYRSIEKASNAHEARLWALQRAVEAGTGYWRVDRRWQNDDDFDQDIVVAEIPNQANVYVDPFAVMPDARDQEWAFIIDDWPVEKYNREFAESRLAQVGEDHAADFAGDLGDLGSRWITAETRRVAEYFYVDQTSQRLIYLETLGTIREDRLPADYPRDEDGKPQLPPDTKTRTISTRTVHWCFINAIEILEARPWGGRYIPIIRTYGQRHNIDGKWVFKGMVADAKDAQRVNNYMCSAQIEMIALGTKGAHKVDPRQIEGLEKWWENANTHNYAYLPVRRWIELDNGQMVDAGFPQRDISEPPIQAITLAIRDAKANIKATTGRHGPALGEMSQERSGRAIRERKVQSELSTSHFLDILANVAIPYEAMVVNDLLAEVYDRPGRNAILVGDTDADEQPIVVGQPFYAGEDGAPVSVDEQHPAPLDVEVQEFTLDTEGEYLVTVSVGKSTQTQKEENALLFSEIIQAAPQLIAQLGDLWVGSLEGPAAEQAAERLKPGSAQIPPEVQAQMQQLEQAQQELQALVQQYQLKEAGKQQQLQAELFIKREEIASRERIAAQTIAADFAKVRATLHAKGDTEESRAAIAALDREFEKFKLEAEQRHERAMLALKAEYDALLATQKAEEAARLATRQAMDADRMDDKQGMREERRVSRTLASDHALQVTRVTPPRSVN